MKKFVYLIALVIISLALAISVFPAKAQLGDQDGSNITIQNISTSTATVLVTFVSETGTTYTPTNLGGTLTNPFTLAQGENKLIYVPNIPSAQLPSGQRYSVVVSSDAPVVATVGVFSNGTRHFHGIYSGFSAGATTVYLANVAYNYSGWYALISVQNIGSAPADITVNISCTNPASTVTSGTLSVTDLPVNASKTWALKNTLPSGAGWSTSSVCQGSAEITSDQPIVAVNNQHIPANGKTNSYEAFGSGSLKVFVPNLLHNFSNWNSGINIVKIGSGSTNVTVTFNDGSPNAGCALSDATPSCHLYMPAVHTPSGTSFGATIDSDTLPIIVNVGQGQSTYATQSGYMGFADGSGSASVFAPLVTKFYSGWVHQINCQNIGTVATSLTFTFQGYEATPYAPGTVLNAGDTLKVYVPSVAFLPSGYNGGVTVNATNGSAKIACTVGGTNIGNQPTVPGDWGVQYNAFNQ